MDLIPAIYFMCTYDMTIFMKQDYIVGIILWFDIFFTEKWIMDIYLPLSNIVLSF